MIGEIGAGGSREGPREPETVQVAPVVVIEGVRIADIAVDRVAGRVVRSDRARATKAFLCAKAEIAQIGSADRATTGPVPVVDLILTTYLQVGQDIEALRREITVAAGQ